MPHHNTNGTNGTTNTAAVYLPTLADTLRMPMDERTEKAILLVEEGRVTVMDMHNAKVKSTTNNRKSYTVTNGICRCKDAEYRDNPDGCAHARAVRLQRALAQYQAVPPQDEPPPWGDNDHHPDADDVQAYYDAIEEGKNRVPTPQEEAWDKVQREFDKPAAAAPSPTVEVVPEPPESVPESQSMPEHTPSWRDHLAPIIHSMSWTDRGTGVSHSVNLRADTWAELVPDIQTISEVAKKHLQASAPKPAAQPEAPATPPAPREEAANEYPNDPGWCSIHQTEMRRHEKNGDVWYSHKDAETDRWCKGPKKAKR
ncbi:MAG: hypothetical protein V3U27_00140 [Candidatus Tectomicrobia bacterium]